MNGHWTQQSFPAEWKLPLRGAGSVRWNAQGVPYVIAEHWHDAAVLAGAVCYLLRGNQIQLFRHAAWGRLAELGGPPLIRVDALIRSLDLHRAQDRILEKMPADTLEWIDGFCAGMNAVAAVTSRNLEARLLGIRHRPLDRRDVLAIGRLTGTDVNWPTLFDLFAISTHGRFSEIWRRLLTAGGLPVSPVEGSRRSAAFWLLAANRSGSNSMAIGGERTVSGKPILASDPHLNHQLPNLWLLIGIQCPQMHAVGLMFPGVPVIGLGRNPFLAWGGTNLRAASSDLVRLTDDDAGRITQRHSRIRVRGWFSVKRTLRDSEYGPVISDHLGWKRRAAGTADFALRWAGHLPSDEISAFLGLMRLRDARQLQVCMSSYGVTGLNVLAAASDGVIAQTHAAWLPERSSFSQTHFLVDGNQSDADWKQVLNSSDFPFNVNPPEGVLLSTNQHPRTTQPVSWYFNGEERNHRLRTLVSMRSQVTLEDVKRWQTDVCSPQAAALCHAMRKVLRPLVVSRSSLRLLDTLSDWDGSYAESSVQALLFEGLMAGLRRGLLRSSTRHPEWYVVHEWAYICHFLLEDFLSLDEICRQRVARAACRHAQALLSRYGHWGRIHRLAPRHVLGFLPWIGRRLFPGLDFAAAGSRETLMKNAHGWLDGPIRSTYGAQARQICDLSSDDHNWFILLGGQDERRDSPHALDQAMLWRQSDYVQMPLSREAIESRFSRVWLHLCDKSQTCHQTETGKVV